MSNAHYKLERATLADLQQALTWPENAAEFKFWFGDRIKFGDPAQEIWQQIQADQRGTFSFKQGPHLLGFGQAYEKVEGGRHIACLIVNPEARGKGIGRAFVEALMAQAFANEDVGFISLNVYPDNEPARALYRSLGYQEEGMNRGMVAMRLTRSD